MLKNDGKKFFLIASTSEDKKKQIKEWLDEKFNDAVVYNASDYMECLLKIKNAPPNVLITEYDLNKGKAGQIIETVLSDQNTKIGVLVIGSSAKTDSQHDAAAIGRIHFVDQLDKPEELYDALNKIAHYSFQSEASQYSLKTLKAGEILIKEGETTQQVYIVRKGTLRAFKNKPTGEQFTIGEIKPGEFVGEMAYFNDEARMASVDAITDSELIEIQPAVFEKVIYQRPSWAKTLISTLAKRLKNK